MNSKNNRVNHDFQIAYFLAGSCHTPDGAYSLLCDLRENREQALAHAKVSKLRIEATRARAEAKIQSDNAADKLDGQADLLEIETNADMFQRNIVAAEAELATINSCIDRLQPLRRFKHLSDPQAHEAAQFDEWRLELAYRAENFLLASGAIPPDQLAVMRQHPAFHSFLLPHIKYVQDAVRQGTVDATLTSPQWVGKLLEAPKDGPIS